VDIKVGRRDASPKRIEFMTSNNGNTAPNENQIMDPIARLRAEAAEHAARCESTGREAGGAWARDAGARALKCLAAAIGHRTVRSYIDACRADPLGLAARLYIDITDPVPGEEIEPDEVNAFWEDALPGDGGAIRDPDVAFAFVTAAHGIWIGMKP
jgi:hypothetical protein